MNNQTKLFKGFKITLGVLVGLVAVSSLLTFPWRFDRVEAQVEYDTKRLNGIEPRLNAIEKDIEKSNSMRERQFEILNTLSTGMAIITNDLSHVRQTLDEHRKETKP